MIEHAVWPTGAPDVPTVAWTQDDWDRWAERFRPSWYTGGVRDTEAWAGAEALSRYRVWVRLHRLTVSGWEPPEGVVLVWNVGGRLRCSVVTGEGGSAGETTKAPEVAQQEFLREAGPHAPEYIPVFNGSTRELCSLGTLIRALELGGTYVEEDGEWELDLHRLDAQ